MMRYEMLYKFLEERNSTITDMFRVLSELTICVDPD